jgi:hypothetical protein
MVDDFVRHLGLKPIHDKKLRTMLEALTSAGSSSSPSPQFEWDPHKPTLYFVPRAAVLSATATQLKRMQELRDSKLLEKMAVDLNEAFQGKGLVKDVLFVSHRWEDWATPDETGAQLAALQAHLRAHPEIQYVWFDYSCMPQRSESAHRSGTDDRTPAEKAEFDLMLKAIADLYLTAKVLILLDTMYRTRFWTTMEGWCSMQQVTSEEGDRPACTRSRWRPLLPSPHTLPTGDVGGRAPGKGGRVTCHRRVHPQRDAGRQTGPAEDVDQDAGGDVQVPRVARRGGDQQEGQGDDAADRRQDRRARPGDDERH